MNILGNIWWKRKHHNKGCKGNGLRCICGDIFGGGSSSKNADEATQQIEGIGNAVQQESALTPQATQQWQGSYNIGQYLQNLFGQEVGMPNATAPTAPTAEQQYQAQGPVSQALYQNVLNQAQNPTAGWQNALAPQLTQAQNTINEYSGVIKQKVTLQIFEVIKKMILMMSENERMVYEHKLEQERKEKELQERDKSVINNIINELNETD